MKPPEILAPVGTKESFFAAIHAGADAIYAGLRQFNARAYAQNFTIQELKWIRDATLDKGLRLYVVLNSTIKEGELGHLIDTLSKIEWVGPDGVIIQDLGTLRLITKYFPGLSPHASTLMTIHNSLGLQVAEVLGFKRVVIAREMTLDEIKSCAPKAKVELECFIFGAMCFTYSGLCLMSSLFGGKASTRGRCVQPCRRIYTRRKGRPGAYFSMLDLDALELLHDLMEAGIGSFKIEGRLRPANYVYHAVKAVKTVLEAPKGDKKALEEARKLANHAFGRKTSKGFFYIDRTSNISPIDPYTPPITGRPMGHIHAIEGESLIIDSKDEIEQGDRLRFLTKDGKAQCVKKVKKLKKLSSYRWRIYGVILDLSYKNGKVFLTDKRLKPFPVGRFHPVEPLLKPKEIHRIQRIKKKLLAPTQRKATASKGVNVWVRTKEPRDVEELVGLKEVRGFYLAMDSVLHSRRPPIYKCPITWFVPPIILEEEVQGFRSAIKRLIDAGYSSFQISNLGALALFPKGPRLNISASYHLNCMNSVAMRQLAAMGLEGVEVSLELERDAIQGIFQRRDLPPVDIVIFGHIPLFTSRIGRHPWIRPGESLKSPKGEEFHWIQDKNLGFLLHKEPFSLVKSLHKIKQLPFRRWVVDLTFGPPGWVLRRKGRGKSILKGIEMPHKRLGFATKLD